MTSAPATAVRNTRVDARTRNRVTSALLAGPFVGALDLQTEVPTPTGMTTLEHLEVGDSVFGATGRAVTVAQVSEHLLDRPCFEVEFSTGERIVADSEQRWLTERRDRPRSALLPRRRATPEVAGSIAELGPAVLGVRVAPVVRLRKRHLPIEPYLLGAWLARGAESAPFLTGASGALVLRLRDLGVRVFSSAIPGRHWIAVPTGTATRGADLVTRLRSLGVLGDKHLPVGYLRASEQQRRDLLAGLLDSGGGVSDGGVVVFRTSTWSVAAGVHQLVASLGYRPWTRATGAGGHDVGFITTEQVFGLPALQAMHQQRRRLAVERRPRRLVVGVRQVPSRPLRRVRVVADDGLLLVSRSFIPMPGAGTDPTARPAPQV